MSAHPSERAAGLLQEPAQGTEPQAKEDRSVTTITQAIIPEHVPVVAGLFGEYMRWVCPRIHEEYGAVFDAESVIAHDMETLPIFLPPQGCLLLAFDDGLAAGCICVRTIGDGVAEMKRMYVRPAHRRKGIGTALVRESVRRAQAAGFSEMRLDSAGFMRDAHVVYRSSGFGDIPPYEGSEIPAELRRHWVFMGLDLTNGDPGARHGGRGGGDRGTRGG